VLQNRVAIILRGAYPIISLKAEFEPVTHCVVKRSRILYHKQTFET